MSSNFSDGNSIPNLLSLRGTRAGRLGRSRGRVGRAAGPDPDQAIQGTDDDAAGSRLSAVSVGYLDDPFAQYFVDSGMGPPPRRLPIINRGTYTRTCALDRLIGSFLSDGPPPGPGESTRRRQIVSLGAGTDTRIFRLFAEASSSNLSYHEIDFPATVAKKARLVQSNHALRHIMGNPSVEDDSEGSWSCEPPKGGQYYCHALDLRELFQRDASSIPGLQTDVPTLMLSECCLCYLETPVAKGALSWFTNCLSNLAVVIYEPVRPNDAFGKMMVSNLAARHIRMPTVQDYETPKDQERRLRDAGLEQANALTIEDVWKRWISSEEKERVDQLEGLDEVEEWQLLADHYVVAWGRRGAGYGLWDPEGERL